MRYQQALCYKMEALSVADFANLLLRDFPEEALKRMERATNCKDLVETLHKHMHPVVGYHLGRKKAQPVMLATRNQNWKVHSILTLVCTLLLQGIPFDSFQRLFYAVQLGLCDSDMLECKKPSSSDQSIVFDTIEKKRTRTLLDNIGQFLIIFTRQAQCRPSQGCEEDPPLQTCRRSIDRVHHCNSKFQNGGIRLLRQP